MLDGETSVMNRAIVIHEGRILANVEGDSNMFVVGVDDLGLGGEDDSLTTGHAGARAACCIITQLPDPTEAP
jgi:Cu/Zn superoxide dismutase